MWKDFLHQVKIAANEPLLFQYVVENIFSEVVKSHFSTVPESSVLPDHLSEHEQNAIRYVAGYIPYALKKKLKRGSHYLKDLFISCLDKLAVEKKDTKGEVEEED